MSYIDKLNANQKQIIALLKQCMVNRSITNPYTQAAILAIISKETSFTPKSERGYSGTDNKRIRKVFGNRNGMASMSEAQVDALKKNDETFFNFVYGGEFGRINLGNTQEGDGYRYRGRGLNQITGRGNYVSMQAYTSFDIVNTPDNLNIPEVAADLAVGYFTRNFKSPRARLTEYNMSGGINDAKSLDDALNAIYHANAGWGKDRADIEKDPTGGLAKAREVVADLNEYAKTVPVKNGGGNINPNPNPNPNNGGNNNNNNNSGNNSSSDTDWTSLIWTAIKTAAASLSPLTLAASLFSTVKPSLEAIYQDYAKKTGKTDFWDIVTGAVKDYILGNTPSPDPNNGGGSNNNINLKTIEQALAGKGNISASVGEGGKNDKADVVIIRALLAHHGYHDKTVFDQIKTTPTLLNTLAKPDNTLYTAIRKFQAEKAKLAKPDGRVDAGGGTLKALNGQSTGNGGNTPPPSDGKEQVRKAQQVLIDKGYLAPTYFSQKYQQTLSSADGILGNDTKAALQSLQTQHGLSPSGSLDGPTLALLADPSKVQAKGQNPNNQNQEEDEMPDVQPISPDASVFPCFN